jgi:hypothetical protein
MIINFTHSNFTRRNVKNFHQEDPIFKIMDLKGNISTKTLNGGNLYESIINSHTNIKYNI